MKTAKILFGLVLIVAGIREWFNATGEIGFNWGVNIALLLLMLLGALLIRNGVKSPKKPMPYMWIHRIPIFALNGFLLMMLFGIAVRPTTATHSINVSGYNIPLDACITDSREMLKAKSDRVKMCECLAAKLGSMDNPTEAQLKSLKQGSLTRLLESLSEDQIEELILDECYSTFADLQWTDQIKITLKEDLLESMAGIEFEQPELVDAYCDCLVEGIVKFPIMDVASDTFYESDEYMEIDSLCAGKTVRNTP